MNFIEYEKQKVSQLSPQELSWKLFSVTGQINYYMLFHSLNESQKEHEPWKNLNSREL